MFFGWVGLSCFGMVFFFGEVCIRFSWDLFVCLGYIYDCLLGVMFCVGFGERVGNVEILWFFILDLGVWGN